MKICNKCKKEKHLSMYYKDKNLKSGYRGSCKDCIKQYDKQRKYKPSSTEIYRTCSICNKIKDITEYYKNKRGKGG